jgi:hypothetical protein
MNANAQQWLYLKIYLGESADKADDMLIELGRQAAQQSSFNDWFFIRYFDEEGFHIRFRVKPLAGQIDTAKHELGLMWQSISGQLADMLPSEYIPMVEMPSFSGSFDLDSIPKKLQASYHDYEPETDKYGAAPGIDIAEQLFCRSSELACDILRHESEQVYSRKSLIPLLMVRCFELLKIKQPEDYWRQYSQFWLGGDTPAAEDHREGFFAKGDELAAAGLSILDPVEELPAQAQNVVSRWEEALKQAYSDYSKAKEKSEFSFNILCFNFSHLMLNRLGLTSIEESYMAALLEQMSASEIAA